MPSTTRSRTKRKEEISSASTSRQSPAAASVASSFSLPAPLTSRTLRPRAHLARSRASSNQDSQSATNSRAGSVAPSRGSSVISNNTDTNGIVVRERKRRRIVVNQDAGRAGDTSSSSHMVVAPRPAWRDSEGYDAEEGLDQLDDSDSEEARTLRVPNTTGPSTNTPSAHIEPVPSTRRQSATPPPPTAISPVDEVEIISTTFTKPSTSSAVTISGDIAIVGSASGQRSRPSLRETVASPVSSASLMKIINETNIEPGTVSSKRKRASASPEPEIIEISPIHRKDKGKGKAKALPSPTPPTQSEPKDPEAEPLSEYTCPICFFPPSNATLTPCGHVCCGSCLFTAVKTTLQRSANMGMGMGVGENVARCPVCRAAIPGWDGKGGGVIGIKARQVFSL